MKRVAEILIAVIRFTSTALLWVAAIVYLYVFLFKDPFSRVRTISMFIFLACVALSALAVIFFWRQYHLYRFGKADRRKSVSPVTAQEMAELFSIDTAVVEDLRDSRHLWLSVEKVPGGDKGDCPKDKVYISGDGGIYEIVPPAILSEQEGHIRKTESGGA